MRLRGSDDSNDKPLPDKLPEFREFNAKAESKPKPQKPLDPEITKIVNAVEGNLEIFTSLVDLYAKVVENPRDKKLVKEYALRLEQASQLSKNDILGLIGSGVTAMYMYTVIKRDKNNGR